MSTPRGNGFRLGQLALPQFLIVGCGRSGSTLLRRLLVERYYVEIPPETAYLTDLLIQREQVAALLRSSAASEPLRRALSPSGYAAAMSIDWQRLERQLRHRREARDLCGAILRQYLERTNPASTLGDKTPSNVRYLPLLRAQYGNPAVVALVRDPRAVISSTLRLEWIPSHLHGAGKWLESLRHIQAAEAEDHTIIVRYEDLVSDTENVLAKVAEFVALRARHTAGGTLELGFPKLHPRVRDPVRPPESVSRLPESQRRDIEAALSEQMQALGYPVDAPPDIALRARSCRLWAQYIEGRRPAIRL